MAGQSRTGQRKLNDEQQDNPDVTRRRFFRASCLATAGLLAGACSRSKNPLGPAGEANSLAGPVPPVPGGPLGGSNGASSIVAVASTNSYDPATLKQNIQSSFEALGGLSDIVKSGDTVGIKLNMTGGEGSASKSVRDYGVDATELYWTHPEILKAVAELLKDAGAGRIVVVEANYDTPSYTDWGYKAVVEYLGAEYYNLNNKKPYSDFVKVNVPNPLTHWDYYYHNGVLHDFDCFVSLPKTKRHYGGGMTNAMKNMIGSVPLSIYQTSGAWRAKLHSADNGSQTNSYTGFKNLVRTIVDLNKIRPIHLAVCDAIMTADNGEGPWNQGFRRARFDTLITSKDPVAADAIGTTLFGFDPTCADRTGPFCNASLPGDFAGTDNYLRIAEEEGLGVHDPDRIQVVDATSTSHVEKEG